MKLVIQRCESASVSVDGKIVGQIGQGFLVLLGIGQEDTEADCDRLAAKMIGLRIFSDENGKTNLSLKDVGGSLEGAPPELPHGEGAGGGRAPLQVLRGGLPEVRAGSADRRIRR